MKLFSPFSKSILAFTAAAMLFTGCKDDEDPSNPPTQPVDPTEETATITSIDPTSGPVGTEVTISGTNFGDAEDDHVVDFNGTEAEITSVTDDAIVVVVPAEATTGNINLTIGEETIEGPEFTVTAAEEPAFTITDLDPTEGPVGTQVTITGTNFGEDMEAVTVSFNETEAEITSVTNEAIVVTVPDEATTGRVSVTMADETVQGPTFTVTQVATEPGIASIDPTSGVPGMTVRINGLGFGDVAEDVTVDFNGTDAEVTRVTDTQVDVVVPEGATTGTVTLNVGDVSYEGPEFTVLEGLEEVISFGDGFPLEGMATNHSLAFIYANGGLDGSNILRLTTNKADRTGSAYYASKIPVSNGFETTFTFRVSRPGKPEGVEGETGADGFSFIIQNQGLSAIGSRGADMAYGGINNAVVVEFDIYENAEDGDVSGNHISVQTSVNGGAVQADQNYRRATTTLADHPDLPEFIGNETESHVARIVYEPGLLQIWVDDMEAPLEANITLEDYMNIDDGSAYVGFTASTSPTYGWAAFDILNWTLTPSAGTDTEGEDTDTEE